LVGKVQKSVYLSKEVLKKIDDVRRLIYPIPSFSAVVTMMVMAYEVRGTGAAVNESTGRVYGSWIGRLNGRTEKDESGGGAKSKGLPGIC